jgi:DNA-directed RNA polymerase specialized sigma24 family protein
LLGGEGDSGPTEGVALRRRASGSRKPPARRDTPAALVERIAAQPVAQDAADEGAAVLEALLRLRALDQEALKLAAWEDLSSREAAQVLG